MVKRLVFLICIVFVFLRLIMVVAESANNFLVADPIKQLNFPKEVVRYQIDSNYKTQFNRLAAECFQQELSNFKLEEDPQRQWVAYTYEDQDCLINISNIMNLSVVTYTQLEFTFYEAIVDFIFNGSSLENVKDLKEKELDFLQLDSTRDLAQQILDKFELNLDYRLNIYGITKADMKEVMETPEGRSFLEYSKPDQSIDTTIDTNELTDIYLITADFYLDGIPLNQMPLGDQERGVIANVMNFSMIVTPSGLASVAFQGVVQPHNMETKTKILEPTQVIDKLRKKYENIILQGPVELKKLDLVYVPYVSLENDRELVPTWQGLILQPGETGEGRENIAVPVFFDAVTEEEVAF